MNHTKLIFVIFSAIFSIILVCANLNNNNNIYVYAQQSSSQSQLPSLSTKTPLPVSNPIAKVKIISPTRGQQVPVGKDLTISGTSMDNATSNCQVSVRVNRIGSYQPATPTGRGDGGGGAAAADYSKWNYMLTSKYTTIKPGPNRITAKYECVNNPALTKSYSINVTGVQAVTQVSGTQNDTTSSRTTNSSIVIRPLPGGACPSGYHLVAGAVCIKDIPTAAKTTTKITTPTARTPATLPPTDNVTKSFSIPSSSTISQPNNANPTNNDKSSHTNSNNNEENFNTKILKSFNKEFKR